MKHIVIILLLAITFSCTTLEYLPNDVDNVPKTLKAQSIVMQQVLDNYYLMGMIDYRRSLDGEAPIIVKGCDMYYLYNLKKDNPRLYKLAKPLISE